MVTNRIRHWAARKESTEADEELASIKNFPIRS